MAAGDLSVEVSGLTVGREQARVSPRATADLCRQLLPNIFAGVTFGSPLSMSGGMKRCYGGGPSVAVRLTGVALLAVILLSSAAPLLVAADNDDTSVRSHAGSGTQALVSGMPQPRDVMPQLRHLLIHASAARFKHIGN